MARSLRSKRRKRNKQALRERYKPIYDARLQAIVKNMQEETDNLMEIAGAVDLENNVQIINPDDENPIEIDADTDKINEDKETDNANDDKSKAEEKVRIPRVHIKKLAKFMSQKKYRSYQAKEKAKKKSAKLGKRKQTSFKW